jgi:capsular exopolysaccharide synthesis family protein
MATLAHTAPPTGFQGFPPMVDPDHEMGPGKPVAGTFNLRLVFAAIRRNMLMIGGVVLAALLLAVLVTLLETPRYTATATVQINDVADQVLGQDQDHGQESINAWDTDRFLQTQVDILNSRGLAERVAHSLKLASDPKFFKAMGVDPPSADASRKAVQEEMTGLLHANLTTDLPHNSRILPIKFTSTDPAESASIANGFAKEFIAANLQRKFDSSAYARNFIADQLADAKTRLAHSEVALNDYARQHELIRTRDALGADQSQPQQGDSVTTASLIQLNQAANDARAKRIEAEGRWKTISSGSPLSSTDVLSNASVQNLLTERADLEAKLKQERAKHLENYPSVIQLKAQLDETERQLTALVDNVRASVKAEYDAALAAEQQLEQQVASLKADTLAEQDRAVQYNLLAREADTNRTIYNALLQRYKELNAAAGISTSNISVIDTAEAPLSPSSPKLLINLVIALVLGVGLAALVVLFRDQFDDSIKVPEDVESKLNLSLLGVIPMVDETLDHDLADPKSALSESYSSLGGALLYSTRQGLPQVILVTSAQPSEGKSTTCHAIASGFARIGKRTVLVDLDLRRPSQHRVAGVDNERGVSNLLTSNAPIASVLADSNQQRLKLITSGPLPPNPTELIASTRTQAVIDELAGMFDVVVIDSPPVLGLADAPLLSALVDGVVLVVEANRSRHGTLKASLRRLRAMRPILLGAVLTKFNPRKAANRYYSDCYGYEYYQYEYRYEDGPKSSQSA